MKAMIRLLLGCACSLSVVCALAIDVSATVVRGEVKQTAAEARLFTFQAKDGRILLVSWDKKTRFINLKGPAAIKPDDYLVVDFTLQGEQVVATAVAAPELLLPPGIKAASLAMIDRFIAGAEAGQNLALIDTRLPEQYKAGHIPGAISIPLTRIMKRTAGLLPPDRNTVLVFYDDGTEMDAAAKAAELTGQDGYAQVMILKEGVRGWIQSGRFLASAPDFIRKSKPALIDVRSGDEVVQGHIEKAVNYPLPQLGQMSGKFPVKKLTPVVVYGASDTDALQGAAIIRAWGFKNVTFLRGGVAAWLASAEPLESGPAAEFIYSDAATHTGQLPPEDFEKAVLSPRVVELVDVRSDAQYRKGRLPQAVHIPLQSLARRHKELSRDKIQVIFAADAAHAEMAYDFLQSKDYRANYIAGSVTVDKNGAYTVK